MEECKAILAYRRAIPWLLGTHRIKEMGSKARVWGLGCIWFPDLEDLKSASQPQSWVECHMGLVYRRPTRYSICP